MVFLIVTIIIILEISYRSTIVDFYVKNLTGLNSEEILENKENKTTILALGDSFTANHNGYISILRDSFPEFNIINSAISGTGINQAKILLKNRLKRFEPEIILYQVYIGNDLLDYKHPYTGEGLTMLRKVYWWLKDHLYIIGYINSKLPVIRQILKNDIHNELDYLTSDKFDSKLYSQRTKMLFQIDPSRLENTILLRDQRKLDFENYIKTFESFLNQIPRHINVQIIVVPHCLQLNEKYLLRMQSLGCHITDTEALFNQNYPFYNQIEKLIKKYQNVNIVNTLSDLRKADEAKDVYYPNDPHLNPFGQKVLANTIMNTIK